MFYGKNLVLVNLINQYTTSTTNNFWKAGLELVKQNRFAKNSECSEEKSRLKEKIVGLVSCFMKNGESFI